MPLPRTALAAFTLALPATALTQPQADTAIISIQLVTIGQGDPYWTRFGHNAIRVIDRERGTDISYNWGLFDFNEPGFLARFLSGNTNYWMAGFRTNDMLAVYASENRTIDVQELDLSPAQAHELRDFVEWNALPGNREYRYDYYRDNCSTRVRDALDRVLGGQIRAATDTIPTSHSFRWHTQRLLSPHLTAAGTEFVLGHPADRPISAWEEMFVPMLMRDHLRSVRIADTGGVRRPLVRGEHRMFDATRPPEAPAPPGTFPISLAIGAGIALAIGALAWAGPRARAARITAAAATTMWSVLAGVAGVAVLGAWLFTHHAFMYGNENVLQVTPLSLALAVLIPLAARSGAGDRSVRAAVIVAAVVLAASVAGFVGQLLPALRQVNGDVIAVALPLHAATLVAVLRLRAPRV